MTKNLTKFLILLLFSFNISAKINDKQSNTKQSAPLDTNVTVDSLSSTWSSISLTITNSLPQNIDVNDMLVIFDSIDPVANDEVWGDFNSVSYPQSINSTSSPNDQRYSVQIETVFAEESWVDTTMEPNTNIVLKFGLATLADENSITNIQVFLKDDVALEDGVIKLTAPVAPGNDVLEDKAIVTLLDSQNSSETFELEWGEVKTLSSKSYGSYTLHVNQVGAYPPNPASQEKSISDKNQEADFTWDYLEAVYPATLTLNMPNNKVLENNKLELVNTTDETTQTHKVAYGATTVLDSLTDEASYIAKFNKYVVNNKNYSLTLDGKENYTFKASANEDFAPRIKNSISKIDTTGFLPSKLQTTSIPVGNKLAITLLNSEKMLYHKVVATDIENKYFSLKPGQYKVIAKDQKIDDVTYRLKTKTINVLASETHLIEFEEIKASDPVLGRNVLAPYKDVSINAGWANGTMEDLVTLSEQSGNKFFTLAFILASEHNPNECKALWGGESSMSIENSWGKDKIDALRATGGDVIFSFGGALGRYLSQACATEDLLFAEYKKVVDNYDVKYLDFDVEMGREEDDVAMAKMAAALKRLQDTYPDVKISFTLAGAPDLIRGFDNVVKRSVEAGVEVSSVNPMTMSFGQWYHDNYTPNPNDPSVSDNVTAELSINTIEYMIDTHLVPLYPQIAREDLYQKAGMIPMQGLNDLTVDYITLNGAKRIANWAKEKDLHFLSFWSINRDHSCLDAAASPICSSAKDGKAYQDTSWQFSNEFLNYYK